MNRVFGYRFFRAALLIAPLALLFAAAELRAQDIDDTEEASGTVFFLSGGRGAGQVHLFTGQQLLRFDYSETYLDRRFALASFFQYGAIWRVRYRRIDDGTLRLEHVTNTGQYDPAVRAADSLVRLHYYQLSRGDFRNAYANLHPDTRALLSYESFATGFRGATFTPLAAPPGAPRSSADAPPHGIKVVGRTDTSVQLLIDMSTFVQGETRYFRFDIQSIDGLWYIGTTSEVTFADWDRA